MKKSIKRIISFALMLSLLVGMMAGFSAFAAETETVEIISKNLYYGDTFNIMYAVNSTSDDVVLNIYTMNDKGELELAVTVDEYITDTVKGVENAKVFTSAIGVPAQNIDKEFYAQAVTGNTKSEMVKYSVLEYLYERLTVSEGVTEEQATMYNSLLAFADAADVVVNKDTTTNIAKYAYVRVTNGTVDGTNTAAMVLGGTALEFVTTDLVAGKGMKIVWEVTVDDVTKTVEAIAEYVTEAGKAYTFTAVEVKDEEYVEEETFVDATTSVVIADYAAANGWVNEKRYESININAVVTAMAAYKTGAQYTANFYSNGNNWRFYQTEEATLTISAGNYNIVSVKITYAAEKTGSLTLNGENVASATVVNVGAPSVTFGVGNTGTATNGQARVSAIEVVYQVPAHNCEYSEATCTAPATCSVCGATTGDKIPHAYDEGVANPDATCITPGTMVYTCSCGDKITETIPSYGHTTEQGTCDRCGNEIGGAGTTVEKKATTKYTFSSYAVGTQYAEGESHDLDSDTKLIINGAHLNTQVRLYASSNCVIECDKTIEKLTVKAGYKAATLTVYVSVDGVTWIKVKEISTTTTYTEYDVDLGGSYQYVKMEATGAQIRLTELTVNP